MIRQRLVATSAMLGLVCGVLPAISAWAQNPSGGQGQGQGQQGQQGQANAPSDPSQNVQKALDAYRQLIGQNREQTQKEIERLRQELIKLINLRYDMAASLAEMRAEMGSQGAFGAGGQRFAPNPGGGGQAGGGQDADGQQAARAEALNRELQTVQQQLSRDVEQARSAAEGLAGQLRTLTDQQRRQEQQRQEQQKKEQEQAKSQANPGQGQGQGQGGQAQPGQQAGQGQQAGGQGPQSAQGQQGQQGGQNPQGGQGQQGKSAQDAQRESQGGGAAPGGK